MDIFNEYLQSRNQLSGDSLLALQNISSQVDISKGEDLQQIGNRCKNIYFVESGILRVFYLKESQDITESFEFAHSFVARADSLFDSKPSRKGIQALANSRLVAIDSQALFALYDQHHDLERFFRLIFEKAYIETVQRLESIQFHSAEERYLNLIQSPEQIIQHIPLKHIASYLGITQVSLSRIRAKT